MRILVVGGAGYVGGALVDLLEEANNEVAVYDSLLYENRYLKPVELIVGDIRDTDKLSTFLSNCHFDAVVWLAAIVGDGACAISPKDTEKINTDSVRWLSEHFDGKIVFTSTCSVYGQNLHKVDEDGLLAPLSIYALSKLNAEKFLVKRHNATIFRFGTLFGLGDYYSRIRFDLVANALTLNAFYNKPIVLYNGGEQLRPLLHVRDAARGIMHALDNDLSGVYNLAMDNFTIREIANAVSLEFDNKAEIVEKSTEIPDKRNYAVLVEKILSTGWHSEESLCDGIREIRVLLADKRIRYPYSADYTNQQHLTLSPELLKNE